MSYELIKRESERVKMPVRHQDDLIVHDFASLDEAAPGTAYLWCVRDWGTHLVLDSTNHLQTRWRNLRKMWLDIWEAGQEPGATHRFYYYDGWHHGLRPVTTQKGLLRVLDDLNVRDHYPHPSQEIA